MTSLKGILIITGGDDKRGNDMDGGLSSDTDSCSQCGDDSECDSECGSECGSDSDSECGDSAAPCPPVIEKASVEEVLAGVRASLSVAATVGDLVDTYRTKIEPHADGALAPDPQRSRRLTVEVNGFFKKGDVHLTTVAICKKLTKVYPSLLKLHNMIGMAAAKKTIFQQLTYFLHDLHDGKLDMLHTVIQGPPGVGKTELGKILAEMYSNLGILKKNKYVIAKRADLIGEYVGQTTAKTQRIIDKANGGVLFIDEAYSIGEGGESDGKSYGKECLDVLNLALSENKNSMMCIIAGYETALQKTFFAVNEGLRRRFNFTIAIDSYTPAELRAVFLAKVEQIGWFVHKPIEKHCPLALFTRHKDDLPFFGGDVESLLLSCKLAHSGSVYTDTYKKKHIHKNDMTKAFEIYMANRAPAQKDSRNNDSLQRMYI